MLSVDEAHDTVIEVVVAVVREGGWCCRRDRVPAGYARARRRRNRRLTGAVASGIVGIHGERVRRATTQPRKGVRRHDQEQSQGAAAIEPVTSDRDVVGGRGPRDDDGRLGGRGFRKIEWRRRSNPIACSVPATSGSTAAGARVCRGRDCDTVGAGGGISGVGVDGERIGSTALEPGHRDRRRADVKRADVRGRSRRLCLQEPTQRRETVDVERSTTVSELGGAIGPAPDAVRDRGRPDR